MMLYAAEVKPKTRNQASCSTCPSSISKYREKKNGPPAARLTTPGSQGRTKIRIGRVEQRKLTSFFKFFLYFLLRLL